MALCVVSASSSVNVEGEGGDYSQCAGTVRGVNEWPASVSMQNNNMIYSTHFHPFSPLSRARTHRWQAGATPRVVCLFLFFFLVRTAGITKSIGVARRPREGGPPPRGPWLTQMCHGSGSPMDG